MLQDLRFTFRLLATERWFSTLGVIVLALGIGVNAIGFTIVNAAFLRGLPFNGQPATIIGVMPEHMNFPDNTELWSPFIPSEVQTARDSRILSVFGRLREGTTRVQAQTEMNGIATQFALSYPDAYKEITGGRVETFTERYVGGSARSPSVPCFKRFLFK